MYSDFELQGVIDDKLNSKQYQAVAGRMHTEEATCSLLLAQQDQGYGRHTHTVIIQIRYTNTY